MRWAATEMIVTLLPDHVQSAYRAHMGLMNERTLTALKREVEKARADVRR